MNRQVAFAALVTAVAVVGSTATAGAATTVSESHPASSAGAATTIPTWTGTARVGGHAYHYTMVGKNPMRVQANPVTNVPTAVVPVVIKFADGITFNPTKVDARCWGGNLPDTRSTMQSQLFVPMGYTGTGGVDLGTSQYEDLHQRMEFWKYVGGSAGTNPNYHVNLTGRLLAAKTVSVPAADSTMLASGCPVGAIQQGWWDNYLRTELMPALKASGVGPTQLPVFLLHNVVFYGSGQSSCCVLGYHSAYANQQFGGATQTYVVVNFDTSGDFNDYLDPTDVETLSAELGDWMDNPFANNTTPSWGHIGSVAGCASALEVSQPVDGVYFTWQAPNGSHYHLANLSYESWFYRQTPSVGLNGQYDMNSDLTTPARACA